MKNNLLKITSILVIVALVLSAFTTISKATEQTSFELDKEYIEVQAGKTASFTIISNKSQEFHLVSANENVCTIFDPQGSTILSSEFKLEATTKTFAVSATAPGETVIRVNAGYVLTEAATVTNEDIRYTGTEDIILVVGLLLVVASVIYIKFEKLNSDMK